MTLGERIKEERLKKDASQAALAELCCVSQQAVGKWEKESASPSLETLQVLADYFGVTVDYLLCRDNKKTPSENGERKGVRIPVYGRIAAGIPISAIQEIIDYEEIPEDMLQHGHSAEGQRRLHGTKNRRRRRGDHSRPRNGRKR